MTKNRCQKSITIRRGSGACVDIGWEDDGTGGCPVPQDVGQIIGVPVGVRRQVFMNGYWVTVPADDAEYIKKLIASVAPLERKVDPAVDTSSRSVPPGSETCTKDVADVVQYCRVAGITAQAVPFIPFF